MNVRTLLFPLLLATSPVFSAHGQAPAPATAPAAAPAVQAAPATEAAPVAAPAPAAAKPPSSSNKWRIKFDESSKSDGDIVFRLWPGEGDPIDITVAVRDHQTENTIARATRDALRLKLGKAYKVELDDGEDVLVKVTGGTKRFALQLVSNAAQDVDIRLHKE